jgi:hypothetical protein
MTVLAAKMSAPPKDVLAGAVVLVALTAVVVGATEVTGAVVVGARAADFELVEGATGLVAGSWSRWR